MKKQLLLLGCLALSAGTFAQTAAKKHKLGAAQQAKSSQTAPPSNMYSFSTFTAPYQPITGTSLTNGQKWDDPFFTVPLNFNFNIYSTSGNTVEVYAANSISFGDLGNNVYSEISPMWEDLCDKAYDPNADNEGDPGGVSNISYTTTGAPGSRIFKFQVENAGFYGENDIAMPSSSTVNFQIWFYEGSNDIEFRYGAVTVSNKADAFYNGTAGFVAGLIDSLDYNSFNFARSNVLNGPHNNPAMVAMDNQFTQVVSGDITSGRVYRFAYNNPSTSVKSSSMTSPLSVYPNPSKDVIFVKGTLPADNEFYITDLAGKTVLSGSTSGSISTAPLTKGAYLIRITSKNTVVYQGKLVISE